MSLARHEGGMPALASRTHLWINLPNESGRPVIHRQEVDGYDGIHEHYWGSGVWSNNERGYYWESLGVVSCHGSVDGKLEAALERSFRNACYLHVGM